MNKYIFGILTLMLFTGHSLYAQDIKITQFDFATSVEDRQPVNTDTTFSADVKKVYCFTQVEGVTDTTRITHVWHHKQEEKARIDLNVANSPWRTWSSKTILESWTGPWRVVILDSEGNVLDSKNFVITES